MQDERKRKREKKYTNTKRDEMGIKTSTGSCNRVQHERFSSLCRRNVRAKDAIADHARMARGGGAYAEAFERIIQTKTNKI